MGIRKHGLNLLAAGAAITLIGLVGCGSEPVGGEALVEPTESSTVEAVADSNVNTAEEANAAVETGSASYDYAPRPFDDDRLNFTLDGVSFPSEGEVLTIAQNGFSVKNPDYRFDPYQSDSIAIYNEAGEQLGNILVYNPDSVSKPIIDCRYHGFTSHSDMDGCSDTTWLGLTIGEHIDYSALVDAFGEPGPRGDSWYESGGERPDSNSVRRLNWEFEGEDGTVNKFSVILSGEDGDILESVKIDRQFDIRELR